MSALPRLLIADPDVRSVPVVECGDPLIDLASDPRLAVFLPQEKSTPYEGYRLVRTGVAQRLALAQSYLPDGIRLRLYEGYRPLSVQQRFFDDEMARVQQHAPHLSEAARFEAVTRLVSPVTHLDGRRNCPPHCTGAAVDVDLVDASGQALDFGMSIDDWASVPQPLCETDYPAISPAAWANRQLLLSVMTAAGFANYFTEWWHFSWGDQYWARLTGAPQACYGEVFVPEVTSC